MLVLSRKPMQRIHIGDSVVVTLIGIRGNRVRIGIDAPNDMHVLRGELLDKVSHSPGCDSRPSAIPPESSMPGGIEAWETEGGARYAQMPAVMDGQIATELLAPSHPLMQGKRP